MQIVTIFSLTKLIFFKINSKCLIKDSLLLFLYYGFEIAYHCESQKNYICSIVYLSNYEKNSV